MCKEGEGGDHGMPPFDVVAESSWLPSLLVSELAEDFGKIMRADTLGMRVINKNRPSRSALLEYPPGTGGGEGRGGGPRSAADMSIFARVLSARSRSCVAACAHANSLTSAISCSEISPGST